MKTLRIIFTALAFISLQAHAEDNRTATRNAASEKFEQAKKAAGQGYASAQYNLGLHYADGRGVAKDGVEAAKWYQKAAAQGNTNAMRMLGNANAKSKLEADLSRNGKVLSSSETGMYTYIELIENGKTIWIAAPTIKVKKGDIIRFSEGAIMSNYFSKSLNRTFESVIFVGKAVIAN